MATLILRSTDVGAPTLNGVNGALCAVLDWAVVQNGWAIEYTATNQRVYRAGVGNRRRLWVCHDSTVSGDARLAVTRGCENASAASVAGLVDPFPTVAQLAANLSTVCVSIAASATARAYRIILGVDFIIVAIDAGTSNIANWDLMVFGDLAETDPADTWATVMLVGGVSTATGTAGRAMAGVVLSYIANGTKLYWCRSIDGSVKSTRGSFAGSGGSAGSDFCAVSGSPVMRTGYANRIGMERVGATCIGSSSATVGTALAQLRRGWVPNLWNPLHSNIGTVNSDDVFQNPGYNALASFSIAPAAAATAAILELSDTWSPPSG